MRDLRRRHISAALQMPVGLYGERALSITLPARTVPARRRHFAVSPERAAMYAGGGPRDTCRNTAGGMGHERNTYCSGLCSQELHPIEAGEHPNAGSSSLTGNRCGSSRSARRVARSWPHRLHHRHDAGADGGR